MDGKVKYEETAETFAVVGCGESPDYQVQGARSDLGCKNNTPRMPTMKFRDWLGEKKGAKNGRKQEQPKKRDS